MIALVSGREWWEVGAHMAPSMLPTTQNGTFVVQRVICDLTIVFTSPSSGHGFP